MTADGDTLVTPEGPPGKTVLQAIPATSAGESSAALTTPLVPRSVTPSSQYVSQSGVLQVAVFTPGGAYQGTAAEYVGAQANAPCCGGTPNPGNIMDVTSQPWGGSEDAGCLASEWWANGNPCQWESDGVTPVVDAAVTGGGGNTPFSTSAVVINLGWRYVVDPNTGGLLQQKGYMTNVNAEVSQVMGKGRKIVLMPWYLSGSGGTGASVRSESPENGSYQTTFTLSSCSAPLPSTGSTHWVDASDSSANGNPQTGTVSHVQSGSCNPLVYPQVTVQWNFHSAATLGQQVLTWGCSDGALPQFEIKKLHGTVGTTSTDPNVQADINAVCDTKFGGYIPNYWDSAFYTDWQSYLSELSAYFNCQGPGDGGICNYANNYNWTDLLYVHAGMGVGVESYPYGDGSLAAAQVQKWALAAPKQTCAAAGGVDQSTFGGRWDASLRCWLTGLYETLFGGPSSTMYNFANLPHSPINLSNGANVSLDVAEWAANQGIAIGSDGLNPSWAFGPPPSTSGDRPDDPTNPSAALIPQIASAEAGGSVSPPPYFELQTVDAQTMYCPNNGESCWPMSQVPSQYGGPYPNCAQDQIMEDVHLAQYWTNVTTLEAFYNDLDDTNSVVETAYNDWTYGAYANDTNAQLSQAGTCPVYNPPK